LENIILSEVSQAQKHKDHIFSHTWKIDPKNKHTHEKNMIIYNSYVEHACNSGTTLWNSGKEGREKRLLSINNIIKYNICEGKGYKNMY
jgi:hypothetical protein